MPGTRKIYNFSEKNYFLLFGIEAKFNISMRSLNNQYKRMILILNNDTSIMSYDKQDRVTNGFNTLHDPISRAKYLIELAGYDTDIDDSRDVDTMLFRRELRQELNYTHTSEQIAEFLKDLKSKSEFIIDELGETIDKYNDYKSAMNMICKFYEISLIYNEAITKQKNIGSGITYVTFN